MSSSRLKNLAIAALLLLNAFFLTMIILDNAAIAREQRKTMENICAILRSNGISVSPADINSAGELRTMRMTRSDEAEAVIAGVFLDEYILIDQGGIYLYENTARGVAEFASAGDFEVVLNHGVITDEEGTHRVVRELLSSLGIETSNPVITEDGEHRTVTAVCTYRGTEIFNCAIEFVFGSDGSLQTVNGRYMAGADAVEGGRQISSAATALLDFLASVIDGEIECTQIYSVDPGYQRRVVGAFGESELAPVWLLTTDTGSYIIDDATGQVAVWN